MNFKNSCFVITASIILMNGSSLFAYEHNWDQFADISKIEGPDACIECHISTGKVWEGMHHFTTFRDMPRSDRAREIADNLGVKRIKTESLCLSCHFTSMMTETGRTKPVAGISCESCHGAGKDWMNVHNDYGTGMTRNTETDEHRQMRIAKSEEAGMIRPAHLFAWASNCYSCHTVPQEKLVNMGGHPAGSKFELVSWSQGEMRHNVWHSSGQNNVSASAEQKRVMYVTGLALDLAYALNGLAKATEEADYAVTMAKRAKVAMIRLEKVASQVTLPEVDKILAMSENISLTLNNESALMQAANQIAEAVKKFSESYDGSTLAGIDSLIPSVEQYRGTPARHN
jgi:hypothetical protein